MKYWRDNLKFVFYKQFIYRKKGNKVKLLSCVRFFATPWTVAYQAPLSMEFSRQEYWSGLLFPSPGDLPNSGIEPRSSTLRADFLTTESPWKSRRSLALLISSGKSGLLWFLDIRLGPHDSLWPMAHEERWGTQHPSRGFRSHYVVCLFPPPGPPKEE